MSDISITFTSFLSFNKPVPNYKLLALAAIAQLSDIVIGLERNQQSQDNPDRVTIRVLKNRFSGDTGIATYLNYNKDTGRLLEEGYTSQGEPNDEY